MVGTHRNATLTALDEVLSGCTATPEIAQDKWSAWVRKQRTTDRLDQDFATVLQDVSMFAGPAVSGAIKGLTWVHRVGRWIPRCPATLVGELAARSWGSPASARAGTTTRTRQLLNSGGSTWIPRAGGRTDILHTEALDVARASGAAVATLWVLTTNQRARHFYERHGWVADGATKTVWRGDVRLDETRIGSHQGRVTDTLKAHQRKVLA